MCFCCIRVIKLWLSYRNIRLEIDEENDEMKVMVDKIKRLWIERGDVRERGVDSREKVLKREGRVGLRLEECRVRVFFFR